MSVQNHLNALRNKHQGFDDRISELEAAPSADSLEINHLKKKKLRIKDEIEAIDSTHH